MNKAAPETPSIQSLDRGLIILEAVAKAKRPVPLSQLKDMLGINRSSVFRLANTLRRRGFLANPNGSNNYTIGPSIWSLFRNYDWTMLVSFCRHHMSLLATQTGETAHLAVREGKQVLFIDHYASSNQVIAVSNQTGEFKPLYCTAHGKALLSDCSETELRSILGGERLERHTARTITSIEELARVCAKAKIDGFAVDDSEFQEEVRCVAAPVRDKDGIIVAAIGISAPVARLSKPRLTVTARQLSDIAKKITGILRSEA